MSQIQVTDLTYGYAVSYTHLDMLCKSEVTAVLQRCSTAYHVAKSGFDSCILSFLC